MNIWRCRRPSCQIAQAYLDDCKTAEYQFQRDSGWKRGLACSPQPRDFSEQTSLIRRSSFVAVVMQSKFPACGPVRVDEAVCRPDIDAAFLVRKPRCILLLAQENASAPSSNGVTFHVSSNLVLLDVVAVSSGTGSTVSNLHRDEFRILDNGRPVHIRTFDTGTGARPLAIWLLVQCNMNGWKEKGSGLFEGQIHRFKPALEGLNERDAVGVAHWCDDGRSNLDPQPTNDVERAIRTLQDVLRPVTCGSIT